MYTDFNDHIYNYSENVSDFLIEYLNEQNQKTDEWPTDEKIDNPKITFFEQRVAALEGGVAALAVKSFNKAKLAVIKSLLQAGDNIVTFNSYNLHYKDSARLNRAGIEVKISEDGSLTTFEQLIDKHTKLIYLETISPEYLNIPDFQKISIIAKEHNIPVLVDNTAAGAGYLTTPLKNGADILIESTKNWLSSHKELIGAVIVDGGNYNWLNGKFPHLLNLKQKQFESKTRRFKNTKEEVNEFSIIHYIKNEGNINISRFNIPSDPLSLVQDLDHLPNVIQRQSNTAAALVKYLKSEDLVKDINYTGLPTNPGYVKALTFFRKGFGAELSFSLKEIAHHEHLLKYFESRTEFFKHISIEVDKVRVSVPPVDFDEIKEVFEGAFAFIRQAEDRNNKEFNKLNILSAIF